MTKVFYDHLILIEDIIEVISTLNISDSEKQTAQKLADSIIHHKVLILLLDNLPKDHHEDFLKRFYRAPYDLAHLKYLEEKTQRDISMDLVILGQQIKREIISDIKKHIKVLKK